ncbi:MAG: hypothetical protein J2P37_35410 [Ktedonobacteraceae bacterium]|nr:hypothetical protein [Ktedonobacteraceae bacterium]
MRCLHTILARIQERVQIIAQQEQDVPSELLASIQTLQALLEGEVQAPLDRLMEQVHDTLTQHDITDPALLHALQQLPAVIEQGAGDALQEALHRVMQRLQILLSPPEASFRDPYHPAGLLLRLDLDWARDVLPQLEPASRQLSLDDVSRLIPLIEEAELQEVTEQEWQCLLRVHPILGETLQTPEALMARLLQKKAELLQFLQRALAQGEPIYCDL